MRSFQVLAGILSLSQVTLFAQEKGIPKMTIPIAHTLGINDGSFSPDGSLLVTSGREGVAKIWKCATGVQLTSMYGHSEDLVARFSDNGKFIIASNQRSDEVLWSISGKFIGRAMGFSPDGSKSLNLSKDSTLEIKDVASGKILPIRLTHDHATRFLNNLVLLVEHFKEVNGKQISDTIRLVDMKSGKNLRTFIGPFVGPRYRTSANLSVVAIVKPGTLEFWNVADGKRLSTVPTDAEDIVQLEISSTGVFGALIFGKQPAQTLVLDTHSGKTRFKINSLPGSRGISFTVDGSLLIIQGSEKDTIFQTVNVARGTVRAIPCSDNDSENPFVLSPDGKTIALASNGEIKIIDLSTGGVLKTFALPKDSDGYKNHADKIQFHPSGKSVWACFDDESLLFDISTGQIKSSFTGITEFTRWYKPTLSQDSAHLMDYGIELNLVTGKLSKSPGLSNFQRSFTLVGSDSCMIAFRYNTNEEVLRVGNEYGYFTFSPSGKKIIQKDGGWLSVAELDQQKVILNASQKNPDTWLSAFGDPSGYGISISDDDKYLALMQSGLGSETAEKSAVEIWDIVSGKLVKTLTSDRRGEGILFAPGGKLLANMKGLYNIDSDDRPFSVYLWDIEKGEIRFTWDDIDSEFQSFQFNRDGSLFVGTTRNGRELIWSTVTGKQLLSIPHDETTVSETMVMASFDPPARRLLVAGNGQLSLRTLPAGELLRSWQRLPPITSMVFINYNRFVSTHADGSIRLFDTDKDVELLSLFAVDADNWIVTHPSGLFDASPGLLSKLYFIQGVDVIDFSQLKDRYYEPGLWKKIMSGEKLREVSSMKSIDLAPDIKVGQVDEKGFLPIELTNRGGGIGEVAIFVFGKEIVKDAREKGTDPNEKSLKLKYFIGNHKNLTNGLNLIAVKAWNKDHWVESRSPVISYNKSGIESYKPAVHILTCGISDYTGNEIDLKYAAKDAEDVGEALQLGAYKLFGIDRSYIYHLTTNQDKDHWPTKKNIVKTFDKISTTAHPLDIVIVYLSGHGINVADGDWHYLAQEAYSSSAAAYTDPAIVEQTTISSNELVELFKKIPAAKQVLIIDACASGKVVENLMAQKDIPSSTLRALDRMKDRTGMHIITGCAADAVSYEASRYGQGVLTYSLLEGIRGAALREGQFVDVNTLFQYAQDRVPGLATGIGGIQTPMVFSPNGSQSFDVGQLTDEEKKSVPIAKIRPVYIRSNFQDENDLEDVLNLGRKVDEALNETSSRGVEAPLIFVDVRDYPEGCKLIGRYKKENGKISLKLKKRCEGKETTVDVIGVDINDLSSQIIKSLK